MRYVLDELTTPHVITVNRRIDLLNSLEQIPDKLGLLRFSPGVQLELSPASQTMSKRISTVHTAGLLTSGSRFPAGQNPCRM